MNKGNEISRRSAIGMIMMAPLAARAYAEQMLKGRDTRPNFLFLLPDQFRFDWLSGNPNLPVRTPNLDALAARGVRFDKAVCASPVCAASRASLASEREYDHCGVGGNFDNYPLSQVTYYQKLRDAGYHVAACGKLDLSKPSFDEGLDGRNHMAEWGFSDMVNCGGKGDAVNSWEKFRTPYEPYTLYLSKKGMADTHAADIHGRTGERGHRAEEYSKTYPTPLSDEDYEDNWIGRTGLQMRTLRPGWRKSSAIVCSRSRTVLSSLRRRFIMPSDRIIRRWWKISIVGLVFT
jgi:arylsulfatase A-like enzyme